MGPENVGFPGHQAGDRASRRPCPAQRPEDILAEEVLTSMRDVYLDVEHIMGVIECQDARAPSQAELLLLLERCLIREEDRAGSTAGPPGGSPELLRHPAVTIFIGSELKRLNSVIREAAKREWSRLLHAAQELWAAVEECASADTDGHQHVSRIRDVLDCSRANIQEIDTFVRHNVVLGEYVARCLERKDDVGRPRHGQQQHNLYVVGVERVIMHGVTMSPVLMALSDLYEGVRVLEAHGSLAKRVLEGVVSAEWQAPSKFSRVTKKFWILPKDIMRFKLFVMQHLPILVYGERNKVLDAVLRQRQGGAQMTTRSLPIEDFACMDSGEVSSVYLDSMPSLRHYHDRLHRRDKAMATRIRWYGACSPKDGEKSIFVERKVHRSAYTGLSSTKERGCIKQREVNDFLRGSYVVPDGHKDSELLSSVMKEICEEQQQTLMRTSYSRTAFQNSTENTVRISMDTNLCMTKEFGYQTDQAWCRDYSRHPLSEDDVAQFPYGVVEIKLQSKPPQWVRELVNSGILLVIPKFSKFLHGTAMLYQQTTENVPYWFLPDPTDEERLTPATWEEMADKECIFAKDAANWLFPQGFELPANQEKHLMLPFFKPKGSKPDKRGEEKKETQAVAAAEAMRELEDESGNRTWCDHEMVPEPIPRKPSWTVYQTPPIDDTDGLSSSSYQTSHTGTEQLGSESGVTVLPYKEPNQKSVGTLTPIQPSPYSMTGSFGVMQYSMSMAKGADDGGTSSGTPVSRKRSASLVRTRVEPKTFFANERTFLQWINVSVLVMFLALSLLSGSSLAPGLGSSMTTACNADDAKCLAGKLSGAIIAPVALAFMGYALFMYKKRTLQILRRETVRYDDQRGPVVLVVILLLAMMISYILTMIFVF
jgi:SPX domain protein involved in polyphosphate accumulation/uncharacterized membrane protein YidH (DUF202 family)